MCLYTKALNKLFIFYNKKIMIIDIHGYETNELVSSKKIKGYSLLSQHTCNKIKTTRTSYL